jgi:hypothetical protein
VKKGCCFLSFLPFYFFTFVFFSYLCALNEKGKNASAGLKMASTAIFALNKPPKLGGWGSEQAQTPTNE